MDCPSVYLYTMLIKLLSHHGIYRRKAPVTEELK